MLEPNLLNVKAKLQYQYKLVGNWSEIYVEVSHQLKHATGGDTLVLSDSQVLGQNIRE